MDFVSRQYPENPEGVRLESDAERSAKIVVHTLHVT